MSALPLSDFELHSAEELAQYLQSASTWREIESLVDAYAHWKVDAWKLLSKSEQDRIQELKQWKDHDVAQKFPLGCKVQRLNDTQGCQGTVVNYWSAYGIDYVTFKVGPDTDWCRATNLKRISNQ